MISRLRGTVWDLADGVVVLDVGGVGYEVFVPETVQLVLSVGQTNSELNIRQVFREDGVALYGFGSREQKRLFDLLLTVKGCGPKVGLSLISQGDETVTAAILTQDVKPLTRATGVGPRLAERILLELKDKIQEEALLRRVNSAGSVRRASAVSDELVDALLALGYRRQEAETAADGARESGSLEEQIIVALRSLARS